MSTTISVLIGCVVALILLVGAILVWNVMLHATIRRLNESRASDEKETFEFAREVIGTLKDVTHTMDIVIKSVEGSDAFTKEKQKEILEVLKFSEGRMSHLIEQGVSRLERAIHANKPNAQGINVTGGQNVFGHNEGGAKQE